jgi:hypothetical protein
MMHLQAKRWVQQHFPFWNRWGLGQQPPPSALASAAACPTQSAARSILLVSQAVSSPAQTLLALTAAAPLLLRLRTGGADHIWLFNHDEGACWAPTEVYNASIILTHWGRLDPDHKCNSAYSARHRCGPGPPLLGTAAWAWRPGRAHPPAAGRVSVGGSAVPDQGRDAAAAGGDDYNAEHTHPDLMPKGWLRHIKV